MPNTRWMVHSRCLRRRLRINNILQAPRSICWPGSGQFFLGYQSHTLGQALEAVTEILDDCGYLVHKRDHKALFVPWQSSGLRVHVFHNDIGFSIVDCKVSSGIRQRDVRMFLTMQGASFIVGFSLSPVVEEKIV